MNWDNSEGVCAQGHYLAANNRGERTLSPQAFASNPVFTLPALISLYQGVFTMRNRVVYFHYIELVRVSEVAARKFFVLLDYLQPDSVLGRKPLQNCRSSWNQPSV